MALQEEFEVAGNWLFRWRSFLPFVLVIPLLMALGQFVQSKPDFWMREVWECFCLLVSLAGAAIRVGTVGFVPARTSGRPTVGQVAASLNTTGCYSIVRHPLYLANFLIWLGMVMFLMVWWFILLFVAMFWLYYERIMYAEEQFLRRQFGESFVAWASRTPAFVPNPFLWQKPSMPFSLKSVLRREYTTVLGLALGYPILDAIEDSCVLGRLYVEQYGIVLAGVGTVAYLVLRTLKKKTRLLDAEGR